MEMTAITAMEEKAISGKILLPEEYSWEQLVKTFPLVDSKKISHDDKLLRYEPKSLKEGFFKDELIKALRSNIPNFRAQALEMAILFMCQVVNLLWKNLPYGGKTKLS